MRFSPVNKRTNKQTTGSDAYNAYTTTKHTSNDLHNNRQKEMPNWHVSARVLACVRSRKLAHVSRMQNYIAHMTATAYWYTHIK